VNVDDPFDQPIAEGAAKEYHLLVSEWRNVVTQGLIFMAFMELIEIGKWVFTDGWSGPVRFHFRLNRQLLSHSVGLVYGGYVYGILIVFGWRAFQGKPLAALAVLVALLLVAIPFRPFLRNFFRNDEANLPAKARELPFQS
jgi:hypothetical protein